MRTAAILAIVGLAALAAGLAACAPDASQAGLGDAQRSWGRALRRAREADWPYPRIARIQETVRAATPASAPRDLCHMAYDLADAGVGADGAVGILDACATALASGVPGDPLGACVQLEARAGYPPDVLSRSAALLAQAHGRGLETRDLVRALDRATVFRTPAWTALQILRDMAAAAPGAPLDAQADLFEEVLGRRGRHLEAQAALAAYREAVRGGLPPADLAAAARRRVRRGMVPEALAGWFAGIPRWTSPPLERGQALQLIAAGLAHGMPDEEAAGLCSFVTRSTLDERDAAALAGRLEGNIRNGLRGPALLAETLENFSGARPSAPLER